MTSVKIRRSARPSSGSLANPGGSAAAWIILVALATVSGCADRDEIPPPIIVYLDADSQQPVVAPAADQYPATHPETGRRTLMPAMHCRACDAWRRVPPPEQLNRAAAPVVCPQCRGRLEVDGPLPTP